MQNRRPPWRWSVVEDVPEVSVAAAARDFDTDFGGIAGIAGSLDRGSGDRLPKAGPAGARLEFGPGVKQPGTTADADESSFEMAVRILAGEGWFRGLHAGDHELVVAQELLPLLVGLVDVVWLLALGRGILALGGLILLYHTRVRAESKTDPGPSRAWPEYQAKAL